MVRFATTTAGFDASGSGWRSGHPSGKQMTEINVTSPTCFQEITDQTGFDVAAMFVYALEQALAR